MLPFEAAYKHGRGWVAVCGVKATDGLTAAREVSRVHRRHRVKVRPDYSNLPWQRYHFKTIPGDRP